MTLSRAFLTFAVLLAGEPALADQPAACADTQRACMHAQIQRHVVHSAAFWHADRTWALLERIRPAPAELVDYLNLDNRFNGYPDRPRAAAVDSAFLADVREALAALPPVVQQLVAERLVGIYLVEDLGGTGYTDVVEGPEHEPVGGYVVLDAGVLRKLTANAWATWKENTPFRPQEGYTLEARIETDEADNRRNAIQYILLHELAHVLSIGSTIHPPWTVEPKDVQLTAQYRFFRLSWRVDRWENRYASVYDAELPQRAHLVYYFGAQLDAADMATSYANLEKTNFVTLYGATRPGDDFAEAFASYVHVVLMKRPWQVTISHVGDSAKVFNACWDEPRCSAKRELLEQMLGLRP